MVDNLRVVIAAAGSSRRMGGKTNKPYLRLNSRPVLAYSLDVFESLKIVDEIVVVAHKSEIQYCQEEIIEKYGYNKVKKVVAGGRERQDSVWTGLKALGPETDYVAVHDGARPLVTEGLIIRLLDEALQWGAAIPGIMARDTLKMVDRDNFATKTLDRSMVSLIQTPQIFKYHELISAYECAYADGLRGTDDASLFEVYIGRVKIVPGENSNIKITTPEDLVIARGLMKTGIFNGGIG